MRQQKLLEGVTPVNCLALDWNPPLDGGLALTLHCAWSHTFVPDVLSHALTHTDVFGFELLQLVHFGFALLKS